VAVVLVGCPVLTLGGGSSGWFFRFIYSFIDPMIYYLFIYLFFIYPMILMASNLDFTL
jgi:hypothetical protein